MNTPDIELKVPPFFSPKFASFYKALINSPQKPRIIAEYNINIDLVRISFLNYKNSRKTNLWWFTLLLLKKELWLMLLTSFLVSLAALFSAYIAMLFLDQSSASLVSYYTAVLFFGTNIFLRIFAFYADILRKKVSIKTNAELVALVITKIPFLTTKAKEDFSSGNLKTILFSDIDAISEFYDNLFRNAIPGIVHLIVLTPFAMHQAGISGLIAMLVACLQIPYSWFLGKISAGIVNKELSVTDRLTTLMGEALSNIRIVRFLGWEETIAKEVSACVKKILYFGAKAHTLTCLIFGMSFSWWMFATFALILSAHVTDAKLSTAQIFAVSWAIILTSRYLMHVANTVRLFSLASPSVLRLTKLVYAKENDLLTRTPSKSSINVSKNDIAKIIFKDVCFSYGEKKILDALSFEINLSKKTAVLGKVGTGKSTIFKLLLGMEKADSGDIFIETQSGVLHSIYAPEILSLVKNLVAYVPQEHYVSSATIGENIALSEDYSEKEAWKAAELAEFSADVTCQSEKLDTEIGENGINLSGGQQQRLCISRAIFSGRSYVLLDDALSAVDSKTEQNIISNLNSLNCGFLLITHRVAELNNMDLIFVIEDGKVAEQGKFTDLISNIDSHFNKILNAYAEVDEQ